jgi:nicotinamidase-related amidase
MNRLGDFVRNVGDKIQRISVTLDSHQDFDIAHPAFWKDANGKNPGNMDFTIITADDVENGTWTPVRPEMTKYAIDYCKQLAANDRYLLCIWPPHCIIGTWGSQVHENLLPALREWSTNHNTSLGYVSKGSNALTEHYSAVQADVPMPKDPSTQLNVGFITALQDADNVLIAGEASSHCVLNTVKDIADQFGDDNIKKIIMLTDAMSPVIHPDIDFPKIADDFINDMKARGLRTSTTAEWAQ